MDADSNWGVIMGYWVAGAVGFIFGIAATVGFLALLLLVAMGRAVLSLIWDRRRA